MTAVLTSHQLVTEYGVDTVDLFRWRQRGWVRPEVIRSGGDATNPDRASTWPDWTGRMVRLLQGDRCGVAANGGRSEASVDAYHAVMTAVADALAEHDDVRWVVLVDTAPEPVACWTAEEVNAACHGVDCCATIVAVPA